MAEPVRWPFALRTQLGDEGVSALLAAQREWKEDVLTTATDRFERRLVDECAKLRVEMAGFRADLTSQIKETEVLLRQDMMVVRQDMAGSRTDILRWAFAFWIGQVVAVGGLFAAMG